METEKFPPQDPRIREEAERIIPQQVVDAWKRDGLMVRRGRHPDGTILLKVVHDSKLIEARINGSVALSSFEKSVRTKLRRTTRRFAVPDGTDAYVMLVERIAGSFLRYRAPKREAAE
ncbi:MAG TPA: hypothetical protein VFL98_03485 [Candidatus Paceibacterota bacterium]|nr:hypothetical protein [Candidatus Paceibacterota bacterium]